MGEPLLHPQLAEILDIAALLGFKVCLTTNGTLLHKALPVLLQLLMAAAVGLAVYGAALWIVGGITKDEIRSMTGQKRTG